MIEASEVKTNQPERNKYKCFKKRHRWRMIKIHCTICEFRKSIDWLMLSLTVVSGFIDKYNRYIADRLTYG